MLYLVFAPTFALGTEAISFKDDFQKDQLEDSTHYIRFGSAAFGVENGILKANLKYQGTATLNV